MQSIFQRSSEGKLIFIIEYNCEILKKLKTAVNLQKNPCSHPVFFINGVKSEVLRAILDFMYLGEVHINNEDLIEFIEMAEQFKIRGVTKENSVYFI